jgi:hypothetical protein
LILPEAREISDVKDAGVCRASVQLLKKTALKLRLNGAPDDHPFVKVFAILN